MSDSEINNVHHQDSEGEITIRNQETQTAEDIPVVQMEDFEIVDVKDKLNLLMSAINKINTNFHHKIDSLQSELKAEIKSLVPRIEAVENFNQEIAARVEDLEQNMVTSSQMLTRIDNLEEINTQMQDDLTLLKGVLQVQDKQIIQNKSKLTDLTARSMANNITIARLKQTEEKENCKEVVLKFFRTQMKMEVQDMEVEVAHRIGAKPKNALKHKLMLV